MPRLPNLDGRTILKALKRAGFRVQRQKGSHVIVQHADGRKTTVPVHAGRALPKGTILAILEDVDLSKADLRRLL